MAMNGSFRTLTFDGEVSTDYGVYISGSGTFNAPERDVEMITIPGRNGNFVLDNGRFENIEVTYRAGLYGVDEENFAEKIAEFRNFLCSKKGYCRLEDDYNPDEYRLAVYKSGLEVEPELLKAGEFDIVFDCKPQRYLKSGETSVIVSSGDTITNPTKFDASPLLFLDGYGTIQINDEPIEVCNIPLGNVLILDQKSGSIFSPDYTLAQSGDDIIINNYVVTLTVKDRYSLFFGLEKISGDIDMTKLDVYSYRLNATFSRLTTTYSNTERILATASGVFQAQNSEPDNARYNVTVTVKMNASGQIYSEVTTTYVSGDSDFAVFTKSADSVASVYLYSSISLNDNIYIDLDLGEAYTVVDGSASMLNDKVYLPAKIPTLQPGENIITFPSTLTALEITPRWWQV